VIGGIRVTDFAGVVTLYDANVKMAAEVFD